MEDKLGFSLAASTPLPDGAYFAPEGTHNYMFQIGLGETRIEVLIPVVPEAGTYKYLQRFGPGLHQLGLRLRRCRRGKRRGCGRTA